MIWRCEVIDRPNRGNSPAPRPQGAGEKLFFFTSPFVKDWGSAGYTLIELIVVIAIIGLLGALIAMNGAPVSPSTHARAAAQDIAHALRAARSEAILANRSEAFTLDLGRNAFQAGGAEPVPLPKDLKLALLTGRDQTLTSTVGRIRFDPDGGSTGGRIAIEGGNRVWWVGVDWLSGRVTVEERPR